MTNPGYVSNRKRKRDLFFFNALFGNGGIEMTGLNLLPGLSDKRSDSKVGLLTDQDQTNSGPSNNTNANPFANLFSMAQPSVPVPNISPNQLIQQPNLSPIGTH